MAQPTFSSAIMAMGDDGMPLPLDEETGMEKLWRKLKPVSYTHLTLPTTPYV